MDHELQEAAYTGDVRFLRQAVATQPSQYFLRRVEPPRPYYNHKAGNMIHIAILQNKEEFIREVIKSLPRDHLHLLFTQKEPSRKLHNPLHFAAKRGYLGIIKLILDFYRRAIIISTSRDYNNVECNKWKRPWLERDSEGNTPLHVGLIENYEECALEIMSMDIELLCNIEGEHNTSVLYMAVSRGCNHVAHEILRIAPSYSLRGRYGLNPLHFLPDSSEEVGMLLLEKHPELLKDIDEETTSTIIHSWASAGKMWPFKCLTKIESDKIGENWRSYLVNHLYTIESTHGNNPFHCAASFRTSNGSTEEDVLQVIEFLIEAYEHERRRKIQQVIDDEAVLMCSVELIPPWYMANHFGKTPLHLAIPKSDKIAIHLLSKIYAPQKYLVGENPLFLAMELGRLKIVEKIIALMDSEFGWKEFVYSRGGNILHAAAHYKEDVGILLADKLPELINERNIEGKTPFEVASEAGATWLVKCLLLKDPSCITKAPLAWIAPCKNACFHLSTVKAFIEHCPNFRKICLQQEDTPLHHLQLKTSKEYLDFLMIPLVRGMKNVVDSSGATPLHRAIEREDMPFVEALVMTSWVFWNIKDNRGQTAIDLLLELCDRNNEWKIFCEQKEIKLLPRSSCIKPQQSNFIPLTRRSGLRFNCFKDDMIRTSSHGLSKIETMKKKSYEQLEKEVFELLKRLKENMIKEEVQDLLEANDAPLSRILYISEQQDCSSSNDSFSKSSN